MNNSLNTLIPPWLKCYQSIATTGVNKAAKNEGSQAALGQVFELPQGNISISKVCVLLTEEQSAQVKISVLNTVIEEALTTQRQLNQTSQLDDDINARTEVIDSFNSINIVIVDIEPQYLNWLSDWQGKFIAKSYKQWSRTNTKKHQGSENIGVSESILSTLILSQLGWQQLIDHLPTPADLWRYLQHSAEYLWQCARYHTRLRGEDTQLQQFLRSMALYSPAIQVDNSLIKYGLRDHPNTDLVTMASAQQRGDQSAVGYYQHLLQATQVWQQLCMQMQPITDGNQAVQDIRGWQQLLLDESLYSRYELVAELYRYHEQAQEKQQSGYVVHQHSYESMGRHYVLIFYGKDQSAANEQSLLQSRLPNIAEDVARRLSLPELHHIVILGVSFLEEAGDTFIELDTYVKAVSPMTKREKHLAKQLQVLKQQQALKQPNNQDQLMTHSHSTKYHGAKDQDQASITQPLTASGINISIKVNPK